MNRFACIAPNCKMRTWNPSTEQRMLTSSKYIVSFHPFPSDVDRQTLWLEAIGKSNLKPNPTSVVCSLHFLSECYAESNKLYRLLDSAVPSIFFDNFETHLNRVLETIQEEKESDFFNSDDDQDTSGKNRKVSGEADKSVLDSSDSDFEIECEEILISDDDSSSSSSPVKNFSSDSKSSITPLQSPTSEPSESSSFSVPDLTLSSASESLSASATKPSQPSVGKAVGLSPPKKVPLSSTKPTKSAAPELMLSTTSEPSQSAAPKSTKSVSSEPPPSTAPKLLKSSALESTKSRTPQSLTSLTPKRLQSPVTETLKSRAPEHSPSSAPVPSPSVPNLAEWNSITGTKAPEQANTAQVSSVPSANLPSNPCVPIAPKVPVREYTSNQASQLLNMIQSASFQNCTSMEPTRKTLVRQLLDIVKLATPQQPTASSAEDGVLNTYIITTKYNDPKSVGRLRVVETSEIISMVSQTVQSIKDGSFEKNDDLVIICGSPAIFLIKNVSVKSFDPNMNSVYVITSENLISYLYLLSTQIKPVQRKIPANTRPQRQLPTTTFITAKCTPMIKSSVTPSSAAKYSSPSTSCGTPSRRVPLNTSSSVSSLSLKTTVAAATSRNTLQVKSLPTSSVAVKSTTSISSGPITNPSNLVGASNGKSSFVMPSKSSAFQTPKVTVAASNAARKNPTTATVRQVNSIHQPSVLSVKNTQVSATPVPSTTASPLILAQLPNSSKLVAIPHMVNVNIGSAQMPRVVKLNFPPPAHVSTPKPTVPMRQAWKTQNTPSVAAAVRNNAVPTRQSLQTQNTPSVRIAGNNDAIQFHLNYDSVSAENFPVAVTTTNVTPPLNSTHQIQKTLTDRNAVDCNATDFNIDFNSTPMTGTPVAVSQTRSTRATLPLKPIQPTSPTTLSDRRVINDATKFDRRFDSKSALKRRASDAAMSDSSPKRNAAQSDEEIIIEDHFQPKVVLSDIRKSLTPLKNTMPATAAEDTKNFPVGEDDVETAPDGVPLSPRSAQRVLAEQRTRIRSLEQTIIKRERDIIALRKKIPTLKKRFLTVKNPLDTKTDEQLIEEIVRKYLDNDATQFLVGQMKVAGKRFTQYRWTEEDKLFALGLLYRNPVEYNVLLQRFTLPSDKTLNKFVSRIKKAEIDGKS